MSKLLFIRSYLMIVSLILLVGLGLDKIMSYYALQENTMTEKNLLQGSFQYIELRLKEKKENIPDFWAKNYKSFQEELGCPLALYQYSDFSSQEHMISSLKTRQIIVMATENNNLMYYRELQHTNYILALGPIHNKNKSLDSELMIIAMYYLLVAGALFLWLWPLSRDLHKLRKAAIGFGEEDFTTRVNLRKISSIAPVADAFNFMTQRIQDLVIAHKELTHAVSHELKTPLARFKFSLEIIDSNDDATQRRRYLQAMKQDVRELDDLIDEMLKYAKLSAENLTLHLDEVNAQQWLQEIVAQYKQPFIKIYLAVNKELIIRIDCHLMSRAINNLIRNGLRYAKSQLKISLDMNESQITLYVEDDGLGIPKEFLEHVFQPFTRLDISRDKQSGGYGLGLAITQKIVYQHEGSISADKSSLGGARFQLTWPAIIKQK
ncbi:MAG: ATP-binding protein [Methylococcales bacterium]|nr:ATP-binding protein [Methylococcales bacterium]